MTESRSTYRAALAWLMDDIEPDFWVTLAFNRRHSLHRAVQKLDHLQAMIDRRLLGPRWRWKEAMRTQFIAIGEHEFANLHFHAVFRVPLYREAFPSAATSSWAKLAPAGDLDIQVYRTIGAAGYSTKQVGPHNSHLIHISSNASRRAH